MRRVGMSGFLTGLLLTALAIAVNDAAYAQEYSVQRIPGAECVPRNVVAADAFYEYRASSLHNTSVVGWEFFVAVCPVSEFVPKGKLVDARVVLTRNAEEVWCAAYDTSGDQVFFEYSSAGVVFVHPMPEWAFGKAEMTVHCLLGPGDSIDRLELVWFVF